MVPRGEATEAHEIKDLQQSGMHQPPHSLPKFSKRVSHRRMLIFTEDRQREATHTLEPSSTSGAFPRVAIKTW
jgi:hypothetical protein